MNKRFALSILVLVLCSLGAVLAMSPHRLEASAPQPISSIPEPRWGTDIQVNASPSTTPAIYRNYSVAINPTNPNNLIAAYESPFIAQGFLSYAWSSDAARSWGNGTFPGPWGEDIIPLQDPHVAFDAGGTGYY